ncbi:uncharacterized protein LOC118313017 isoform X2 [Scophthalmus maximus]|uniref:uncharacterized protein LOC118313017 isoform X2 n=1 Tax=Scophthalmus maximus TaxID=52904 RepID=UPI001FA93D45|nr:uncharacterized protein LOC118313017 isoform X2 [Scophthalmus maximus]
MPVVIGGRSLWIYTLMFTFLQVWGRLSTSTSSPILPAPTLDIYLRSKDAVVLVCEVPRGQRGVLFMLYRLREEVGSQELPSGAEEVQFTVRVKEEALGEFFCCLYKDRGGRYSAFSPYLQLEHQNEADPTRSMPSPPPPVLSVEPSTGVVKCGETLSFSCTVPALPPPSQSRSRYPNRPVTFLLLMTAEPTGPTSVLLQAQASLVSSPGPQSGVFTVGPVRGGEGGRYTCIYQITKKRQLVNSTVSNVIQVTVADMLPRPTLVLHQQTDVWHLLCTGSPAYPGALFSLYLADTELPVASHQAKVTHHQATFPVPVQDAPVVLYQCQYSVLLGKTWSSSERSQPLAVTGGVPPPPSVLSGVDWPLVLGSSSAVVLFLCSVALVVVVAHRKERKHSSGLKSILRIMLSTLHSGVQASPLRNGPMGTMRQLPDLNYGTLTPRSQPRSIRTVCSLSLCLSLSLSLCVCVCFLYLILANQGHISWSYTAGQEELFPKFLFHVY